MNSRSCSVPLLQVLLCAVVMEGFLWLCRPGVSGKELVFPSNSFSVGVQDVFGQQTPPPYRGTPKEILLSSCSGATEINGDGNGCCRWSRVFVLVSTHREQLKGFSLLALAVVEQLVHSNMVRIRRPTFSVFPIADSLCTLVSLADCPLRHIKNFDVSLLRHSRLPPCISS